MEFDQNLCIFSFVLVLRYGLCHCKKWHGVTSDLMYSETLLYCGSSNPNFSCVSLLKDEREPVAWRRWRTRHGKLWNGYKRQHSNFSVSFSPPSYLPSPPLLVVHVQSGSGDFPLAHRDFPLIPGNFHGKFSARMCTYNIVCGCSRFVWWCTGNIVTFHDV